MLFSIVLFVRFFTSNFSLCDYFESAFGFIILSGSFPTVASSGSIQKFKSIEIQIISTATTTMVPSLPVAAEETTTHMPKSKKTKKFDSFKQSGDRI